MSPDLGALPVGEAKTRRVREMFDTIAPTYERVNTLVTFGLDRRWRRRAVRSLMLPTGSLVLDVATGTGDLAREAERQGLRAVGIDLSLGMLTVSSGPRSQCDVVALPARDATFDGAVCGYALRNFTDLQASLTEMARVIRPGGRIALLDVCRPQAPLVKQGFELWFDHAVPAIGGLIADRAAYSYLPKSTAYLPDPETMRAIIRSAGFAGVNHHMLSGGLSQLWVATRSGPRP